MQMKIPSYHFFKGLILLIAANPAFGFEAFQEAFELTLTPPQLVAQLDEHTGDVQLEHRSMSCSWQGEVSNAGSYQLWITYYCEDDQAELESQLNGETRRIRLLNIGSERIGNIYDDQGRLVKETTGSGAGARGSYYFRHYAGNYSLSRDVEIGLVLTGGEGVRIHQIELVQERTFPEELEPLFFAAIDFYTAQYTPNELPRCTFNAKRGAFSSVSSIAVCGIALTAHAMNHELGRDPNAADKVLNILNTLNGKNPDFDLGRHESGFIDHFFDARTGRKGSGSSTIDTGILISGVLVARNTFPQESIRDAADELWNSIDWPRAVIRTDPSRPKFYFSGEDMDRFAGEPDPENIRGISMYNEYILLAYFCQKNEDQIRGSKARSNIMPDLYALPLQVYAGRVLLGQRTQPSFLVQFPFYMSELHRNDLFFSFTAAQAAADRKMGMHRSGDRTAWGVSPGTTPEKAYSVDNFRRNPQGVVRPRIVAGFIPVYPVAADDLYLRYRDPGNRWNLSFGTILPGFVPGNPDWRAWRLPGVDFSSLMYGLAAHHPRLGMGFFREATRFTFQYARNTDDTE